MRTSDKENSSNISTHFLLALLTGKMGYYGTRAAMLTYLLKNFTDMTRSDSLEIYGYYGVVILFSAIAGALIADLLLGNKRMMIIGALLQAVGALLLCTSNKEIIVSGIYLIAFGNGIFSPNLMANYGKLYLNQFKKLDAEFTFMMVILFLSSLLGIGFITGVSENTGFIVAFIISAILFLISAGLIAKTPHEKELVKDFKKDISFKKAVKPIAIIFLLSILFNLALSSFEFHVSEFQSFLFQEMKSFTFFGDDIPWRNVFMEIGIPLGVIFYFLWKKYYYTQFPKYGMAFLLMTIGLILISFLGTDINFGNTSLYLIAFLLISCAEVFVYPLVYSIATQYGNPKYLASIISIFPIMTALGIGFQSLLYYTLDSTTLFGLVISLLAGIGIFVYLYFNSKKSGSELTEPPF